MRPRPHFQHLRAAAGLLLGLVLLTGTGCTEVEETLAFDSKGGGTYRLVLRRDADLWQRVRGVLGKAVLARIEGRPFPLTAVAWQGAVKDVEGVTVTEIVEADAGGGMRELRVALAFTSLEALLQVEPLARRSCAVTVKPVSKGSKVRMAELSMTPITALPVLDPLAALMNAIEAPPAESAERASRRDPTPLRRIGVDKGQAEMLRRLLEPALAKVKLTFRVEVPGTVLRVDGRSVGGSDEHGQQAFSFADLRNPKTDRRVRVAWRVRELDAPPAAAHQGDRADAAARRARR